MADVSALLTRCEPVLLELCGDSDPDFAEAPGTLLFLTDRRRFMKVLWRQLFVLDSMMSLLGGLNSAQQLMTQPCPPPPEGGARSRWKALKAESRRGWEETEAMLEALQERAQQLHRRRQRLSELVQELQVKHLQQEQLQAALMKAQNALTSCDQQLSQLRAESEAELGQLTAWQQIRDQLQAHIASVQDVMQVNLLAFDQSELRVELRPRPLHQPSKELEPLKLSVRWIHDDQFRLQVHDGAVGVVQGCGAGPRSQLLSALLEVMQSYMGQAELLTEIQRLRSSFAIDWSPAHRSLVYLRSASLVCHLEVDEGYPARGRAHLRAVHRDGRPVDTTGLQPHKPDPSLTEWLVFLCSSPLL